MSVSRVEKRKSKQATKAQKRKKILLLLIAFIVSIVSSICMIYSLSLLHNIENKARILITLSIILLSFGLILGFLSSLSNKKSKGIFLFTVSMIYAVLMFVGSFYILKTYKVLANITSDGSVYSSSLIALKDDKANKINDIGSGTIGLLSDTSSIDGNQIPNEIIKKQKLSNKVEQYEDYPTMLKDFYDKKVNYIFVPTNYGIAFQQLGDEYETIEKDTKILYTKEKTIKEAGTKTNNKIKDPFTVLIMGVDSEKENIKGASFNGDALMLITFNPTTLNTTILSIPRDSYVPIACFSNQLKNKITHAAAYGEKCMINTIQNFTGIDIDYYVKINFSGVVKLIDKLGGVEVDVPYSFCEQDSKRRWGSHTVFVKAGKQTLNGEQALAFSRHRKVTSYMYSYCGSSYTQNAYYWNDFIRGQNQQLVVRALLNKLKTVNNLNTIYSLLDTLSNNMETNMQTSEILSLYNIGKDIIIRSQNEDMDKLIGFQRLYLNGRDARIYDPRTQLSLYNYVLYEDSVNAVIDAMKVNLGKKEPEWIKEFSFDATTSYEAEVIGKEATGNLFKTTESEISGLNSNLNTSSSNNSSSNTTSKKNTTTKKPDTSTSQPATPTPTPSDNTSNQETDNSTDSNVEKTPSEEGNIVEDVPGIS